MTECFLFREEALLFYRQNESMMMSEAEVSKYDNRNKWGISAFGLKIIAAITMILDHTALILVSDNTKMYYIMRCIGRISFPIFCFLLVEGYFHTKSKIKHCINLLVFALLSEVPYDLMRGSAFNIERQNVIFTLLIGFVVIWALDEIFSNQKDVEDNRKIMSVWQKKAFTDIIFFL